MNNLLNSNKKKWTIGIVNFNSSVYIKYILKTLYEFNKISQFNIVIVDNSNPHEKEELEVFALKYRGYNNLEIIYNKPTSNLPSHQHGEALNIVLSKAKTKFLLVQDPDFFWVKRNYLKYLEQYLDDGYFVVGSPYKSSKKIIDGDKNFPAAFGCAYQISALDGTDFLPSDDLSKILEEGKDVGWKIRDKLSNQKFLSFNQKPSNLHFALGQFSYKVDPYEYLAEDGSVIAYHLFKGSRGNKIPEKFQRGFDGTNIKDFGNLDMIDISDIRSRYAAFFYYQAKFSCKIFMKVFR